MQNNKNAECTKVEIVRINNPYDFWISVRQHKKCLNIFSSAIARDENINNKLDYETVQNILYRNLVSLPIGYYSALEDKWYRARMIELKKVFGGDQELVCYLIDTGETCQAPISQYKKITNKKLINFSPLVKHCALYGIKPNPDGQMFRNKYEEWIPAASSYFISLCNTENSSVYYQTIETQGEKDLIKLYLKLNNTTKDNNVMNINKLLVGKKFAIFVPTEPKETQEAKINLNVKTNMLESYLNTNNSSDNSSDKYIKNNNDNINEKYIKYNNDNNNDNKQMKSVDSNNNEETKTQKQPSKFSKFLGEIKNHSENFSNNIERQNSLTNNSRTQSNLSQKIESIKNSQYYEPNRDIILDGFKDLKPVLKYDENNFHSIVVDYIKKKNQIQISEFQSYCLASILNGRHLLAMTNKNRITPITYIYPLISMTLKEIERLENSSVAETGYIKNSISRAQNGPILLIICSSCKDAQIIFETINDMLELILRYKQFLAKSRLKKIDQNGNLRALIIDGGGHDYQYDVPLFNGCEILISSTPFSILRIIGNGKTNLERLKYVVFDEAHILVEKFPKQIKTLMSHYNNLLNVNDNQNIAQLMAFTSQWSPKLRKLVDDYFYDRVIIGENKLEGSYFGQTHHVLKDCLSMNQKINHLISFIQDISIYKYNVEDIESVFNKIKHTIIFVEHAEIGSNLYDQLRKANFFNLNLIHKYTQHKDIEKIEKLWNQFDIKNLTNTRDSKRTNVNLILIIQDEMLKHVNIDCAKLVIHFDLPRSKTVFSDRLWFMRRYFSARKEIYEDNSINKTTMLKSSTIDDIVSNNYYTKEAQNQIIDHDIIMNASNADEYYDETTLIENELVSNDNMRLCSVILFTLNDNNSYIIGSILNYLKRIGYNESKMSKLFVNIANKQLEEKEKEKSCKKLCPYIKAYGKCLEIQRRKCEYRHLPFTKTDQMGYLNNDTPIPNEGYVRFKVSYVEDANFFFINILGYQNLRKQTVNIDLNVFMQFDMELQAYFSNPQNVKYSESLKENDMCVIKDISTSIFKRVVVTQILKRDSLMAHEVIVQAIDYGAKYSIATSELIIIPDRFKNLPPQAVEVYLCNIRPIDCDLNWSSYSKLFIAEKLLKTKEFVGKIQMAAGRTLWLDPITSFNHLKDISLVVVDDSIRMELISKNYGVKYSKHIEELRNLFIKNGVSVSRLEDETFLFEKECLKLYGYLYNLAQDEENNDEIHVNKLISYSFLDQPCKNEVQVSAVDTPSKFYVQKVYSFDLLSNLNKEFEDYLAKINDLKAKLPIQLVEYEDEKRNQIKAQLDYIERMNYFRKHFNLKSFEYLKSVSKYMFCFACLKRENNQHFRAEIVDVYENKENILLKVFFVDYGDYDTVCMEDIYPIEEKYLKMLPFQVIECQLNNLRPIIRKQEHDSSFHSLSSSIVDDCSKTWPPEAGDNLWCLTHNQDNDYLIIDAYVQEEINSRNDSESSCSRNIRCYSVCLKIKHYPVELDVSHLMVASQEARFSKDELNRLFLINLDDLKVDDKNDFKNDAKRFLELYFRSGNVGKQSYFIKNLLTKSYAYRLADQNQLLDSGIINALAFSLFFVKDKDNLVDILTFLRRELLIKKPDENVKSFFSNNGVANLITILLDKNSALFRNKEVFGDIFKLLTELICQSSFLCKQLVNNEKYLRSLLMLVEQFKYDEIYQNYLIEIFTEIYTWVKKDEDLVYSERFGKYLGSLKTKLNAEKITELNDFIDLLLTKIEMSQEDKVKNDEDQEKEEEEKLKRCLEYVSSIEENNTKFGVSDEPIDSSFFDKHPNFDDMAHSSDEEVFTEFLTNFCGLLRQSGQNPIINNTNVDKENEPEDYVYPKMSWDQTNDMIILKVFLANVTELKLVYMPTKLSFRAQQNNISYGFDLQLFSSINEKECNAISQPNFVLINLKKQHTAIWTRLLSTLNKPKFIKSEYNNLDDVSSDEENVRANSPRHYGRIDYESSSNNSDSSSDFDDVIANDLKESKDVYWD